VKAKESLSKYGKENEPAGEDCLYDRKGRERKRLDVQAPGEQREDPSDLDPPASETDRRRCATDGVAGPLGEAPQRRAP
jgi:hypothetical protein